MESAERAVPYPIRNRFGQADPNQHRDKKAEQFNALCTAEGATRFWGTVTPYASRTQPTKSTSRQRTIPSAAGIGPRSTRSAKARRLAINHTGRPIGIEPEHPVPDHLKRHPIELSRVASPTAIIGSPQCLEAPRLVGIIRRLRQITQPRAIVVVSKIYWCGHREPDMLAALDH